MGKIDANSAERLPFWQFHLPIISLFIKVNWAWMARGDVALVVRFVKLRFGPEVGSHWVKSHWRVKVIRTKQIKCACKDIFDVPFSWAFISSLVKGTSWIWIKYFPILHFFSFSHLLTMSSTEKFLILRSLVSPATLCPRTLGDTRLIKVLQVWPHMLPGKNEDSFQKNTIVHWDLISEAGKVLTDPFAI